MDSILREILERHEYRHSTDYEMSYCSCGVDTPGRKAWLDHIESLESQQAKTRGKGMEHFPVPDDAEQTILPPQRSMTPEEVAGMKAYRETMFKRVAAQEDELREEVPIIHGRAELVAHDAALRASVREELLKQGLFLPFGTCKVSSKSHIAGNCCPCEGWTALASEKAASEEVAQASNELGTCDILSEPHETGFTYSPTHLHLCSNWRPLPKGDAK